MKLYENEAALCTAFADHARDRGWDVYPETGGFDLLLVATDKVETRNARVGEQIGVEAKLHCNIEVLAQAMPRDWGETGPHFHAVLVPFAIAPFSSLARRLSVLVFEGSKTKVVYQHGKRVEQHLASVDHLLSHLPEPHRVYYDAPVWIPDTVLWTPAGVKSPKKITPWKVKAIRMCLYMEEKGFATLADFRERELPMSRWRNNSWIVATEEKIGRMTKYRLNPAIDRNNQPPHLQYPEITEQLRGDKATSVKVSKKLGF